MLATSGNAGWGRDSWSRRSSFAGSRDTNRSQPSSRNWKRWRRLSRGLSNRERRRRVGYAGVATFHGAPGVSAAWAVMLLSVSIVNVVIVVLLGWKRLGAPRSRSSMADRGRQPDVVAFQTQIGR